MLEYDFQKKLQKYFIDILSKNIFPTENVWCHTIKNKT